jgi:hypothetical protein
LRLPAAPSGDTGINVNSSEFLLDFYGLFDKRSHIVYCLLLKIEQPHILTTLNSQLQKQQGIIFFIEKGKMAESLP